MTKRMIAVFGLAAVILVGAARPADARVGVSIGIGVPGVVFGAPVYPAPAYYYPAYPPPPSYYGYAYPAPTYYYGPPVVGGVFIGRFGHGHRHWRGHHRGWRH